MSEQPKLLAVFAQASAPPPEVRKQLEKAGYLVVVAKDVADVRVVQPVVLGVGGTELERICVETVGSLEENGTYSGQSIRGHIAKRLIATRKEVAR